MVGNIFKDDQLEKLQQDWKRSIHYILLSGLTPYYPQEYGVLFTVSVVVVAL